MEQHTMELFSSQPEFHVNRPVAPGSNEARQMCVGSGLMLSECLDKSSPLKRFSKTLLAFETWGSPEFLLTWKLKVTKCGCSVFQLAPSAPRTGGSDIGLWPTIQKQDAERGPELPEKYMNGVHGRKIASTMNLVAWPTPTKRDDKGQTQNPDRMDYVPNIVKANGVNSSGCLARTESFVVRLTTLSSWLMGYTAQYFRHWETLSFRKLRTKL